MSGNVWEWLNDWYGETAYSALSDGVINPGGPGRGVLRDARGGSWNSEADYLYATYRYGFDPSTRIDTIGFRCARSY
jgi:formylglycine-generating enzyme required for sulfatase activity